MTNKPKTEEEWKAYIDQKYRGKTFKPSELHNERVRLEKKYGEKIILGKPEDMATLEEAMEKVEYDVIGNELSKLVPDYKRGDDLMKEAYKMQRLRNLLFARGKKIFLVVLGVLLLLALLKYLFT
jgi:hypothetical protein